VSSEPEPKLWASCVAEGVRPPALDELECELPDAVVLAGGLRSGGASCAMHCACGKKRGMRAGSPCMRGLELYSANVPSTSRPCHQARRPMRLKRPGRAREFDVALILEAP
jgi:hypothetical protein